MKTSRIKALLEKMIGMEVDRRMKVERQRLLNEVSAMILFAKNELLAEISKSPSTGGSDFERAMGNISNIPYLKENLSDKVVTVPPTRRRRNVTYAKDPLLNSILSDTDELMEPQADTTSILDSFDIGAPAGVEEPWSVAENAGSAQMFDPPPPPPTPPSFIEGVDGKVVDTSKESVKGVLDVLNNTNFYDKMKKMEQATAQLRKSM